MGVETTESVAGRASGGPRLSRSRHVSRDVESQAAGGFVMGRDGTEVSAKAAVPEQPSRRVSTAPKWLRRQLCRKEASR
jgi:hypothetical protein